MPFDKDRQTTLERFHQGDCLEPFERWHDCLRSGGAMRTAKDEQLTVGIEEGLQRHQRPSLDADCLILRTSKAS